jgi:hypothetical protein
MAGNPFQQGSDTGSATPPDKNSGANPFGLATQPDKKAGDLKEVDLYQLGNVVEKETIYLAAGGGGMTEHKHNYLLTVKGVADGKVQNNVVLMAEKDSRSAKLLMDAKPGELMKMTLEKRFNHVYVTSLGPYELHPGENLPNVYLFVETSVDSDAKPPATVVKVYKLEKFASLAIPNVRDKDSGKLAADPELLAKTGKFAKAESIEVTLRGGGAPTIKTIDKYALPQAAVYTKLTEADVEGGTTPAVEVIVDTAATTLLVPGKKDATGKWVSDPALTAAVKRFKKDDKVTVRFLSDGDKNWLKEITRAPKTKPGDKPVPTF